MDAAQPLTAEELVLLRTLQDRALRSKKAELLPESSVFRGQGFPSQPDPNDDAVSEWSEVDAGNMTDSSKRRLGPDMAPLSYPGASMMSPMPMPVAMNGPLYEFRYQLRHDQEGHRNYPSSRCGYPGYVGKDID